WESRYKSSPIDTDRYLLACCRYVELNPVRAGMVVNPADYPWSSYRSKVGQGDWQWLDADACFVALGETADERYARYRTWVTQGVPDPELALFRDATRRGQLAGDGRFIEAVESMLARRIRSRGPGRPRITEK
ncbi:MAG: transposase, partial [Nevskiales bacterium]